MKLSFSGEGKISQGNVIGDVEKAMDPSLKRVRVEHLSDEVVVQNESYGESPRFEVPKDVLDYLDQLIRKHRSGGAPGPISVLKYKIEDESSLPVVLSKLETAKNTFVLSVEEFKIILDMLGVSENNENVQETIKIGQHVNLLLDNGEFAWPEPRRVRGIHRKNNKAFIDDMSEPFSLDDLVVFTAPEVDKKKKKLDEVDIPVVDDQKIIPEIKETEIKTEPTTEELVAVEESTEEKNIEEQYQYILNVFGDKPFSYNEYLASFGYVVSDSPELSAEISSIFQQLIQKDKIYKIGDDEYSTVGESQVKSEEFPDSSIENVEPKEMELYKGEVDSKGSAASPLGMTYPEFEILPKERRVLEAGSSSAEIIKLDRSQVALIEKEIKDLELEREEYFNDNKDASDTDLLWYENRINKLKGLLESGNNVVKFKKEELPYIDADFEMINEGRQIESGKNTEVDDTFVGPMPEDTADRENLNDTISNLKVAQEKYAQSKINYRNKNIKNHKWMTKIREGLGIQETTAEVLTKVTPKNIEDEIRDLGIAQAEYIAAKKVRMMEVVSAPVTPEEITKHGLEGLPDAQKADAIFRIRAIEQAESEWDSLQKKITELTPTEEKGRIMKVLESWSKKPLVVRLGALPILIGVAIALAPGLGFAAGGIAAGTAYAGVRVARGVGGYFGAKYAGKGFDSVMDRKNIKTHNVNIQNYGETVGQENFEEVEKFDMENREIEAKSKQQQRIAKAVVMVGAGAGVGIATGYAEALGSNAVFPGTGHHIDVPSAPTTKPVGFWQGIKNRLYEGPQDVPKSPSKDGLITEPPKAPQASVVSENVNLKTGILNNDAAKVQSIAENTTPPKSPLNPAVETPVVPKVEAPEIPPVKVELSSRGFIQTFDDLKGKLKAQYPDEAKMPAGVKSFIDRPSAKLAEDYGFYDAKKGLSGFGLKGEHLTLDSKGNLSLEHLDGKKIDAIDTAEHKFAGKMVETNKSVPHSVGEKHIKLHSEEYDFETGQPNDSKLYVGISPETNTEITEPSESIVNPDSDVSSISKSLEEKLVYSNSTKNYLVPFNVERAQFNFQNIPGSKTMEMFYDSGTEKVPVAKFVPSPDGKGGSLTLLDKYQDGKKYGILRQAFAKTQEGVLADSAPLGKTVNSLDFEKGKIQVVRGFTENGVEDPNAVKVVLNGKEIAKGVLNEKGPNIKLLNNVNHGWFMRQLMADTVYERALKTASKTIKAMKLIK